MSDAALPPPDTVTPQPHPSYLRVFLTFARNSLVRDMTFRTNFIIEVVTSLSWMSMNLGYYLLVFQFTPTVADWGQYQFLIFLSTTLFVNSLVQALFMPNAEEFSELIRTGNLDFALLKPIDTQFLISLNKINWSSLGNFVFGLVLIGVSLARLSYWPTPVQVVLYPVYLLCGVAIFYSLMITLAATYQPGESLGTNAFTACPTIPCSTYANSALTPNQ